MENKEKNLNSNSFSPKYFMNFKLLYYFAITIVILALIFMLFISISRNKIVLFLEIVLFLFFVYLFVRINYKKSMIPWIDIRVLFILFYTVYSLYVPIVFLFSKKSFVDFSYVWPSFCFTQNQMEQSFFVTFLFFIGYFVTNIFLIQKNKSEIILPTRIKERFVQVLGGLNNNYEFYFWFVLSGICIIFYLAPYFEKGFIDTLFLVRIVRINLLKEFSKQTDNNFFKIGYLFFNRNALAVCFFMMYRSVFKSKKNKIKKYIFYICIILFTIFSLLEGNRRYIMYTYISCICYYIYVNYSKELMKNKFKKLLFIIIVFSYLFLIYQNYRVYIPLAYEKGISYALEMKKVNDSAENKEREYKTELAGVYLNNLLAIKYLKGYFYGETYLHAIISPIPIIGKVFTEIGSYSQERESKIKDWFSDIYPPMKEINAGLGFTPSAEAYLNFGYIGAIISGIFFSLFFQIIYLLFLKTKFKAWYFILLVQALNSCRISFLGVTNEIYWMLFFLMLYTIIYKILFKKRIF